MASRQELNDTESDIRTVDRGMSGREGLERRLMELDNHIRLHYLGTVSGIKALERIEDALEKLRSPLSGQDALQMART
jgi:hypothetical protein